MKSTNAQLQQRGYVNDTDKSKATLLNEEQALKQVESAQAQKRTIAILALRNFYTIDDREYNTLLLALLSKEKALYTKLALCESLEQGAETTIKVLASSLGIIGTNQYLFLPKQSSKKVSYPLPRDIIARIYAKMPATNLPYLLKIAATLDTKAFSEMIDALGFIIFYHPSTATNEILETIYDLVRQHTDSLVVIWKFTTLLSAFRLPRANDYLAVISTTYSHPLIQSEVTRSKNISQL